MFRSFDASTPPATAPPGVQAVCGYIGGRTPHVWTPTEWQRFGHLKQAGIWVADLGVSPLTSGREAVDMYRALGWLQNAGNRRILWLDMEDTKDDAWVNEFGLSAVQPGGYEAGVYESESDNGNPVLAGKWAGAWDGISNLPAGCVGHQYLANQPFGGTEVDYSVFEQAMIDHFGEGPRRG
jgi:hypothetical protein